MDGHEMAFHATTFCYETLQVYATVRLQGPPGVGCFYFFYGFQFCFKNFTRNAEKPDEGDRHEAPAPLLKMRKLAFMLWWYLQRVG